VESVALASGLLVFVGVVLAVKIYATLVEFRWLFANSQRFLEVLDRATLPNASPNFAYIAAALGRPRPVYRWLERKHTRWRRLAAFLFITPAVVTIAVVALFALSRAALDVIVLGSAVTLVALVMLSVACAPISRLVLGSYDVFNPDLRLPRGLSFLAATARGENRMALYFLILVYESVLGFAAAYYAISGEYPAGFTGGGAGPWDWIYFSVVTAATVGYGDMQPAASWSRILVTMQITTGPLLLSWLIASFVNDDRG
jgi:hypothetical protein